jgi:hypothetical protein
MKLLSLKNGFETDHSSTETKCILGYTVTCDYDWWTCEFKMPYNKQLYDKIKKYNASGDYELYIEKEGKVLRISIHVHLDYGAIERNDPFVEFANYCNKIRENILKGDYSDLKLLNAYVEDEKIFAKLKSSSGIKKILEMNC